MNLNTKTLKNSIVVYFSGTGNSKYLAEVAAEELNVPCHSIEEDIEWQALFYEVENIVVVFPIYGSLPPIIMRDFLKQHAEQIKSKAVISFPTQMMFSGDGGSAIGSSLPGGDQQIAFARHFDMPNNVPNIPFVPLGSDKAIKRKSLRAKRKMIKTINQLKSGKIIRQGCSDFAKWLGSFQRDGFLEVEKKQENMVRVNDDCIACGLCVKHCPTDNLVLIDKK